MGKIKKVIFCGLLIIVSGIKTIVYSQQQTDIPWPTLANSEWPMIKHDPQFTGRTPFKGPQNPNILWIKDMVNGIFSGPVIGEEGNLYFGSYYVYGDYFYSYTADGNFIWQYETGSGRAAQAGILIDSNNTIYFGSTFGYKYYAISSDGELKWKLPLIEQQQQVDNTGAITKDGTLYLGVHDVSLFGYQTKTLIAIRDTGTVAINEGNIETMNYSLSQNHPNPFNPTTNIEYQIPDREFITLKIFDVLGREVLTLVNEQKEAGMHTVKFDASNMTSGIYFYQIRANNFVTTKKMLLLR